MGFVAPRLLGPGDGLIEQSLRAPLDAAGAAAVFLARFALTLASYATGAAGGLFAPLLVLGAEAGVLVGHAAEQLRPLGGTAALPIFAIVGMGALFAGSVRAPATGVVLMIEMTGALPALVPLVYATVAAELTARALGARPIYEALLERTLARERHLLKEAVMWQSVRILPVLFSAIAVFVLGALWYSPFLFGRAWVKAHGFTEETIARMRASAGRAYAVSFVCYVIMALAMSILIGRMDVRMLVGGVKLGAVLGIGFAAPLALTASMFSEKRLAAWLIDAGYQVASLILMGVILVAWRG